MKNFYMKFMAWKLYVFVLIVLLNFEAFSQICGSGVNYGSLTITNSWQTTSSVGYQQRPYWSFNATSGVIYSFSNCGGTAEDTYLRIYNSSWTQIAYNDDNGPYCSSMNASIDWTCPTSGTYYILLTNYSCDPLDNFQLLSYKNNSTSSDHCYTCPTYDFGPFSPSVTPATHSSSTTTGAGCRWYAFYVTTGVEYVFSTCSNGGSYSGDSRMILYNNSCTVLANVDDYCSLGPQITWTATYDGIAYLQLAHYSFGAAVSWTLAYWRGALPGENCSNPQDLASLPNPYSGTTVGYADDISACRTGFPDRIFYIDVPNAYILDIWEPSNGYDEWEYLGYGATCPGTQIQCWDNDGLAHTIWTNTTGSTQRVWWIQDAYSGSGTFNLQWTLTPGCTAPAAPASCSSAIGTPANGIEHHTTITCSAVTGADGYSYDYSFDNVNWNVNWFQTTSTTVDVNNGDSPNSPLYYRVRAYKCSPQQYSAYTNSSPFPIYTACDEPAAPTVSSPTSTTLNVTINNESPVSNPSYTTYSIYCVTTGTYVTATGTLGTEVYQTKAAWGTIMVTGLSCGTNYTFYAKAQNAQGDIRFNASNTGSGTTVICPPNCATLVSPSNGGSGVLISGTLNWSSGGGSPTGYKLYFGTSPSPPYVGDLGGATSYDPSPDMNPLTTYYWQIVPYNAGGDASGCSVWSFSTGPANDICANATPINEVSNLAFNTSSASASGISLSCVYGTHIDLWYAYTASVTGTVMIDLCGSSFDTGLGVFSSCGGSELACNDDDGPACGGLQSSISMNVTNGLTYFIMVAGYNGATGAGDLSITAVVPANDICANATPINEVSNLAFNTTQATASGVSLSCVYGTMVDLWYAYTSTLTGTVIIDLCGSSFDTGLGVFSSCGGSELACNDDDGPACEDLQSSISMNVTNGLTYFIMVAGYNGATGAGDLSITAVTPGLWTGNISTDWSYTNNWDDFAVPTGSVSVNIPTSPSGNRFPETNTGSGAVCNNITINSGAHLYIPSNNTLTVNGTLTNNAGETGLRIESDVTGTGSLISSTTGVDAKVERFLTDWEWHFIGMPVESSLAGVFHLPSGHSDIYLREHIESTNTWGPYIVPVTYPLGQGKGYETWVGDPAGFHQDETILFNGKLNAGNYTTGTGNFCNLEYTSGHGLNLISNPYPSALQANINTWTKTNIAPKAWIWSPAFGNYVFWGSGDNYGNGNYGTMTGGIIPEMQAFFVEATGSNPSLTIPQSDRIHSSQAYYKDSEIPLNTLRFDGIGNGYQDAMFISFKELSTHGYDTDYDIEKLFGLDDAPQLYTEIPGKKLSINALPAMEENLVIPIGFECGVPSDFTITVSGIEGFDQNIEIFLEDLKEGIIHNLIINPDYSFVSDPLDESSRFLLHFGNPNAIGENSANSVRIYANENLVHILNPMMENLDIEVYDVVGRQVTMKHLNGETKVEILVTSGTGYYLVKVLTGDKIVTQKVFIK